MSAMASPRGFTLFEALVATGILVTTLAGLAHLFVLGTRLTRQATVSGAALVAAQDKLEELVGSAFGYAGDGSRITAASLEPSPESTLDEDHLPYVDWIDAHGKARSAPEDALFARRWRVSSFDRGLDAVVVEVCVFRMPNGNAAVMSADACLATIRARQP